MPTLQSHLDHFFSVRTDVTPGTRKHWEHTRRNRLTFFSPDRRLDTITAGDAKDFERWLSEPATRANSYAGKDKNTQGLAQNTVRKRCGNSKQFFDDAVAKEILTRNPFAAISCAVRGNVERQHFVDRKTTARIIDACSDYEWRLLVALARYGGLRNPSETLVLRWDDINWETSLMTVRSKKTERYEGKASREIPIFFELREFLQEAWDQAEAGQKYAITRYRDGNTNLRTQLLKILKRTSVRPYPKLWKNLRSSRSTEVEREFGAFLESQWIGYTQAVAREHYLMVTQEDLDRATACEPKATQNATQYTAATGGTGSQLKVLSEVL